jgi:hypothetical protein
MVKAIQLAIPASLPRRTTSSLMLKQTSLPAASRPFLSTTSTMNNVTSDFPSYTHQDFHQASPFDSNNQGNFTLHGQTGEPGSADPAIEPGTTGRPRMLTRGRKRSLDTAFGSLPLQGSASKHSRTGRDKLTSAGKENVAVLSVPVSTPIASMQIRYRPPKASAAASRAYADVLSVPDLLENALSPDDVIAARSTSEFLGLPLRPGIEFANFIEGLKILVMHASLRERTLPDISADEIFRAGMSRIKNAALSTVQPEVPINSSELMLSQAKELLFALDTPREFVELANVHRLKKPGQKKQDKKRNPNGLHACFYALKNLGVLSDIKRAIKSKDSPESQLSCQKRIDAMRLRMLEKEVAKAEFPVQPDSASMASAISPRSSLIAKLEAKQRITVDEVRQALSQYIESLDQIRAWIRLVHACSLHLSLPSNQVDGFDAVALVRLASVQLGNQQQRWRTVRGNEEARKFGREVERYRLDASTPVEHVVAARAAANYKAHPRTIDLNYADATIENGIRLFAPIAAVNAILSSSAWAQDFGKESYEELLAECAAPMQAEAMALDSDAIVMAEIASMPPRLGRPRLGSTENTTATTTTTTTATTTVDFIAAIATPAVAAPVAQAEAAIPFTPAAGQVAGNGNHPAPQAQAAMARNARSLFSIESIVNNRV